MLPVILNAVNAFLDISCRPTVPEDGYWDNAVSTEMFNNLFNNASVMAFASHPSGRQMSPSGVERNPMTAEELSQTQLALVGGLVARVVSVRDGKRIVIIEGGFAVAPTVPKDWMWWYQ